MSDPLSLANWTAVLGDAGVFVYGFIPIIGLLMGMGLVATFVAFAVGWFSGAPGGGGGAGMAAQGGLGGGLTRAMKSSSSAMAADKAARDRHAAEVDRAMYYAERDNAEWDKAHGSAAGGTSGPVEWDYVNETDPDTGPYVAVRRKST